MFISKAVDFQPPTAPSSLPRWYCSGKQLQINVGRCEQPGNFECSSGIHNNPRLCICMIVNTRENISSAEMLFITFPILPWNKGYFLIKHVTGITKSALMTKWGWSGKQIKPYCMSTESFDTISKCTFVVDCTVFYAFSSLCLS